MFNVSDRYVLFQLLCNTGPSISESNTIYLFFNFLAHPCASEQTCIPTGPMNFPVAQQSLCKCVRDCGINVTTRWGEWRLTQLVLAISVFCLE